MTHTLFWPLAAGTEMCYVTIREVWEGVTQCYKGGWKMVKTNMLFVLSEWPL